MPPADTRRVVSTCVETLCLHVLSSFQRTGCRTRHALAIPRRARRAPLQQYFLQGNLTILQSVHRSVNPFSRRPFDFLFEAFEAPHRIQATLRRYRLFSALEVRRGSGELKEVFDSALSRFV